MSITHDQVLSQVAPVGSRDGRPASRWWPLGARQWVLTAYTLAFASLLLLAGRLADRFGARRTLISGAVGFAAASAVGGAAIDGAMLIAARAGLLLVIAIPIVLLINAGVPQRVAQPGGR